MALEEDFIREIYTAPLSHYIQGKIRSLKMYTHF